MKRLAWGAAICVAIVALFPVVVPAPTYTYVVKELAQTFNATMTFASNIVLSGSGATVDGKNLDLVAANAQTVHICASGCEYTTLALACAGETSTEANPIIYYVHAGYYTSAAGNACSGEAYATITGDGPGATIIEITNDTFTDYGAIELGTSTNMTVKNMTLRGHRGIWIAGGGADLGTHRFENLYIKAQGAAGNEDCIFIAGIGSGTRLFYVNNVCNTVADGFTFGEGQTGVGCETSDTQVYGSGNQFLYTNATTGTEAAAWAFRCPVCIFQSAGDQVYMVGNGPDGRNIQGYLIDQSSIGGCDNYIANIVGANVYVKNTNVNGDDGQAYGVILNASSLAGTVNIVGSNFYAETDDDTTGEAYAVRAQGASAKVVNIVGGKYQQVGGTQPFDITEAAGGDIRIMPGTQYLTAGNPTVSPIPYLNVSGTATFAPPSGGSGPVYTDSDTSVGFAFVNSDAANNEGSPYIKLQSSAVSAETFYLQVDASGNFMVLDSSFAELSRLTSSGQLRVTGGNLVVQTQHGEIQVGGNLASDFTALKFDTATTDAQLTWVDSANRMDVTGVDVWRYNTLASAPAACTIGDFYVDTSGAYCACSATNTWENMVATGACA